MTGPGQIDSLTGVWMCPSTLADVGPPIQGCVRAQIPSGAFSDCCFEVQFTDAAPTISCQTQRLARPGVPFNMTVEKDDVDCDTGFFSITSVTPTPQGAYSINATTGVLAFTPDPADDGQTFGFTLQYTDSLVGATCTQTIVVDDCCVLRGDVNLDGVGPNVADLTRMVSVLFQGGGSFLCVHSADVNGDFSQSVADLTYLVTFLFRGGPAPVACP